MMATIPDCTVLGLKSERDEEDLVHLGLCMLDCGLKIHSRYPGPEKLARSFQRI